MKTKKGKEPLPWTEPGSVPRRRGCPSPRGLCSAVRRTGRIDPQHAEEHAESRPSHPFKPSLSPMMPGLPRLPECTVTSGYLGRWSVPYLQETATQRHDLRIKSLVGIGPKCGKNQREIWKSVGFSHVRAPPIWEIPVPKLTQKLTHALGGLPYPSDAYRSSRAWKRGWLWPGGPEGTMRS